jgi:hypothetical protein
MKFIILCLFTVLLLTACSLEPYQPTKEEKEEVFKAATYDNKIIDGFPKYDSLAQILLANLDTIIKYKNSKNLVGFVTRHGDSIALKEETCYEFFDGNPNYNIKTFPQFLFSKVDSLWTLMGKPTIKICNEKRPATISITINCDERKNNVVECHRLYWGLTDFDNYDSFDLVKDTLLKNECIYRLGITTNNSGW